MTAWINQYEIAAIVIMVVLLVLHTSEKKIYTVLSYYYVVILVVSLLTAVTDEIAIYTLSNYERFPLWVNYFVNVLYSIMSNCVCMLYVEYAIYATKMENKIKQILRYVLLIPGILVITMIMTTPTTGWAFTIKNGEYTQGTGFYLMYIVAVIYVLLAAAFAVYNRRAISSIQLMAIIYFSMAMVMSAVFTLLFPDYLLNAFVSVIGLILIYLSMETDLVDSDKKLNTFNGNALNKQIEKSIREQKDFYLVALKIGNYDKLNASYGYESADKILSQIAEFLILKTPGKKVFHLTGVQFVMYLECDMKEVALYIRSCEERFSRNFRLKNLKNEVIVPYEITVIHAPEQGNNAEQICGLIEYSFNDVRKQESRRTIWIDDRIIKDFNRKSIVENALDMAVRNGGFEVHYQPVKRVSTDDYPILEALVRIRDEYGELIPPEEFVPVAVNNGAIVQVTDFVLNSIFKFVRDSRIEEKGVEKIHINLSTYECIQPTLFERIKIAANYYGVNPGILSIDISEDDITYSSALRERVFDLADIGIDFNLDDYGVGYSNATELIRHGFNIVKIDKSILWMAVSTQNGMKILKNMIRMLKDIDKKVLAEGVETEEQARMLTEMGCEYLQGYIYSRPLDGNDVAAFVSGIPKYEL